MTTKKDGLREIISEQDGRIIKMSTYVKKWQITGGENADKY
jgi:hypothetical protein